MFGKPIKLQLLIFTHKNNPNECFLWHFTYTYICILLDVDGHRWMSIQTRLHFSVFHYFCHCLLLLSAFSLPSIFIISLLESTEKESLSSFNTLLFRAIRSNEKKENGIGNETKRISKQYKIYIINTHMICTILCTVHVSKHFPSNKYRSFE